MGDWKHAARCRRGGPSGLPAAAWFDGVGDTAAERAASKAAARRECAACPVASACLTEGLRLPGDQLYGLWGGVPIRDYRRRLENVA